MILPERKEKMTHHNPLKRKYKLLVRGPAISKIVFALPLIWGASSRWSLQPIVPHTVFGPHDHREDAPHFTAKMTKLVIHLKV